jgi:hypothetical protein
MTDGTGYRVPVYNPATGKVMIFGRRAARDRGGVDLSTLPPGRGHRRSRVTMADDFRLLAHGKPRPAAPTSSRARGQRRYKRLLAYRHWGFNRGELTVTPLATDQL